MVRLVAQLALLLFALSACDEVFGLHHIKLENAACGPYTSVTPIAISSDVSEPRGFSISEDGTLALVTGTDAMGQTRPIPLTFNDALAQWEPAMGMQAGLVSGMKGAQLAPAEPAPVADQYVGVVSPVMLVTSGTPPRMARYYFSGTFWEQDFNQPDFGTSGQTPYPGNVWVVTNGNPLRPVRHTVMTLVADDPAQDPTQVVIAANTLPTFFLELKNRTAGLNDTGLAFTQAVMTEDRGRLVYAATMGDQSDIYAVQQSAARNFEELGNTVQIAGITGSKVEPWIDRICSKMYFRNIPADGSNAAGQIYLAE